MTAVSDLARGRGGCLSTDHLRSLPSTPLAPLCLSPCSGVAASAVDAPAIPPLESVAQSEAARRHHDPCRPSLASQLHWYDAYAAIDTPTQPTDLKSTPPQLSFSQLYQLPPDQHLSALRASDSALLQASQQYSERYRLDVAAQLAWDHPDEQAQTRPGAHTTGNEDDAAAGAELVGRSSTIDRISSFWSRWNQIVHGQPVASSAAAGVKLQAEGAPSFTTQTPHGAELGMNHERADVDASPLALTAPAESSASTPHHHCDPLRVILPVGQGVDSYAVQNRLQPSTTYASQYKFDFQAAFGSAIMNNKEAQQRIQQLHAGPEPQPRHSPDVQPQPDPQHHLLLSQSQQMAREIANAGSAISTSGASIGQSSLSSYMAQLLGQGSSGQGFNAPVPTITSTGLPPYSETPLFVGPQSRSPTETLNAELLAMMGNGPLTKRFKPASSQSITSGYDYDRSSVVSSPRQSAARPALPPRASHTNSAKQSTSLDSGAGNDIEARISAAIKNYKQAAGSQSYAAAASAGQALPDPLYETPVPTHSRHTTASPTVQIPATTYSTKHEPSLQTQYGASSYPPPASTYVDEYSVSSPHITTEEPIISDVSRVVSALGSATPEMVTVLMQLLSSAQDPASFERSIAAMQLDNTTILQIINLLQLAVTAKPAQPPSSARDAAMYPLSKPTLPVPSFARASTAPSKRSYEQTVAAPNYARDLLASSTQSTDLYTPPSQDVYPAVPLRLQTAPAYPYNMPPPTSGAGNMAFRLRRRSSDLPAHERWTCTVPNCDKFYKRSSSRSIRRHLESHGEAGKGHVPYSQPTSASTGTAEEDDQEPDSHQDQSPTNSTS